MVLLHLFERRCLFSLSLLSGKRLQVVVEVNLVSSQGPSPTEYEPK